MRTTNPKVIDFDNLAAEIERGIRPVLQFSEPAAYAGAILEQVNRCCERFGAKVHVRFYGGYGNDGRFDCRALRRIPAVQSLGIDCLTYADHLNELKALEGLEDFRFGVFESDEPRLLEYPSLARLRGLIVGPSRRGNIDLAPVAKMARLEDLAVCGHTQHLEAIAEAGAIQALSLNSIPAKAEIGFVSRMKGLRSLRLVLGGRENLSGVRHEALETLRVLRVRKFDTLDLRNFPGLRELFIEDQLRLTELDLTPVAGTLRVLNICNCKGLERLRGMEQMKALEYLWVGKTKLNAEDVIARAPASMREMALCGYSTRRNKELEEKIRTAGFAKAKYRA